MTSAPSGAPRTRRDQFATELRRTRMLAGLSGRDLAQATRVSQSTISPAERGQAILSPGTTWADATHITGDHGAVLLALAEAALNEMATFRARLSSGPAVVQYSVRDLEPAQVE